MTVEVLRVADVDEQHDSIGKKSRRALYLVTGLDFVDNIHDAYNAGLPAPGTTFIDLPVRSVDKVKVLTQQAPYAVVYSVYAETFSGTFVFNRTLGISVDEAGIDENFKFVGWTLRQYSDANSGKTFNQWSLTDVSDNSIIARPACVRRVVTTGSIGTYTESMIENFNDENHGRLYYINQRYWLYRGSSFVVHRSNEVEITDRFWSNAHIKAIAAGVIEGFDTAMPDLPAMYTYRRVPPKGNDDPKVVAINPELLYELGDPFPWR